MLRLQHCLKQPSKRKEEMRKPQSYLTNSQTGEISQACKSSRGKVASNSRTGGISPKCTTKQKEAKSYPLKSKETKPHPSETQHMPTITTGTKSHLIFKQCQRAQLQQCTRTLVEKQQNARRSSIGGGVFACMSPGSAQHAG